MTRLATVIRRVSSGGLVVVAAVLVGLGTLLGVAVGSESAPRSVAEQAHAIATGLRCPVCGDLSAADSPAPLAGQMRRQIAEQLDEGRSAEQIRAHFVAAYGNSVLMTPPRRGVGHVAYLLPLLVLGGALTIAGVLLHRWRGAATRQPLTPERPTSAAHQRRVELALDRLRREELR